jgi:hypothetical protein
MVYNAYKGVIYTDLLKNTNKHFQYRKRNKYYKEAFYPLFFLETINLCHFVFGNGA